MQSATHSASSRSHVLWHYFIVTYCLTLVNTFTFLKGVEHNGAITLFFSVATYLTYSLFYLLPAFILVLIFNRLIFWKPRHRIFNWHSPFKTRMIYALAVFLFSFVQIFIFADASVHRIFGFHINGFVWNLVFTRGGIESLGSGGSTIITFALIIAVIVAAQIAGLFAVLAADSRKIKLHSVCTKRAAIMASVVVLFVTASHEITYGISSLRGYSPVLVASQNFPFYIPLTFRSLGKSLGFEVSRETAFKVDVDSMRIKYPLKPITRKTDHKKYNMVWLVAESWRADMLDPAIMPATAAFARKSTLFLNHYSGGNGTRMALFSMFYGLYGSYWFPFLEESRGPIFIDLLKEDGYQMEMFTSAKFTYPEFDRTLFVKVAAEHLHEARQQPGWKGDRENVTKILEFIEKRDPARPFMTFMFFESPHARYYFPPENAIRTPYSEDLNYANLSAEQMPLVKNRYINSCNHLDSQIARILKYLEEHKLLDSTIVMITGDHGEEFMEKGRWGHNSNFSEEQVRVPMVVWMPGKPAGEITHMTSHLDVPATFLPIMGVTNPAEDYSFGYDLFGKERRPFTIISDWDAIGYADDRFKVSFPMKVTGFAQQKVTTKNDVEIKEKTTFYEDNKARLLQIFSDLRKFSS